MNTHSSAQDQYSFSSTYEALDALVGMVLIIAHENGLTQKKADRIYDELMTALCDQASISDARNLVQCILSNWGPPAQVVATSAPAQEEPTPVH